MGRFKLYEICAVLAVSCTVLFLSTGCTDQYRYAGLIKPQEHNWLKGRKIFIDPGHGGKGKSDPFRIGPHGVTEEDVNLKVALILRDMLQKAGAVVRLSRHANTDVPLADRVKMAELFGPDLLVSIHHNGTVRRDDGVNYPSVLFWGSREINPAGFGLAGMLLEEFNKIMETGGTVCSDFAIFNETGARVLRETKDICPGVIGEAGFFSDEKQALRLMDFHYLIDEAEAYFGAISKYIRWGIPSAEIHFSCPVESNGPLKNLITERSPVIAIKIISGNEQKGINEKTLIATIDGIGVKCRKVCEDTFTVDYGKELYPGIHRIRLQFDNLRQQSSMVMSAVFTMKVEPGDHDRLAAKGAKLLAKYGGAKEGLLMLLSAFSMGQSDPGSDKLLWDISRGFALIGDRARAEYYKRFIYYFYPKSEYRSIITKTAFADNGYFYPAEYHGKPVPVKGSSDVCQCISKAGSK